MSSRRDNEASRERKVKRIAIKYGLNLLKPDKPFLSGYMLREEETGRIVFGDLPARFSKSLDEIEAYVEELASRE